MNVYKPLMIFNITHSITARRIVSSEVFAPPTISTSGIKCGGIERMGDDAALRMGRGARLDFAHGEPRRA